MLAGSLTACGGSGDKATLPAYTCGSSPSTTTTIRPTTTPPTATATGPVALTAHSTHDFNGLTFVVNLPADIPAASKPRMRLFSEFLQAVDRTAAANRLDPAIAGLASAEVVKKRRTVTGGESVQGIGTVTYTIRVIHTVPNGGPTQVVGCLDQGKLLQVRKNGTQFDQDGNNNSTLKMTGTIERGGEGLTRLQTLLQRCGPAGWMP
jgi:hypothetical protein